MHKQPSPSTKGTALEQRVFSLFQAEIEADRFWAKKENCKVFWRKGYHSKDRGTDIVFDVSIELYLPGAEEYSVVVLVECKNYKHSVPVDDLEEFYAKVQQVAAANAKAVLASTASFQAGARSFAKSKGIGLMRCLDAENFKWELKRSPSTSLTDHSSSEELAELESALSSQEFQSRVSDLYFQSPTQPTNSLWRFVEDIALSLRAPSFDIRDIANQHGKIGNQVPHISKEELEGLAAKILSDLGYSGGMVDLETLCEQEAERAGLKVNFNLPPQAKKNADVILGRIQFDPLVIDVYHPSGSTKGRDRFTLAHELAHHLLRHGDYLIREACSDSDFSHHRGARAGDSDVVRMEYQANYLAGSLLLPQAQLRRDFRDLIKSLDILDKGFGQLYLDDQPCNRQNFNTITAHLRDKYGISRQVARIRLETLGLLRDARRTGSGAIQSLLTQSHLS